jgi:hypothetical protein
MKLEWSAAALADLDHFAEFLHDQHPRLASRIASEIIERVRIIALMVVAIPGIASEARAQSLPLERGYYVQSDTPCQRASNATLTLYNGISFGQAHAECRKPVIRKLAEGCSYQVTKRCRDVQGRGGPWEISRASFAIRSRMEFVETTQFGTFSFRYCKQSDLPDPWNTIDLRALGISPRSP